MTRMRDLIAQIMAADREAEERLHQAEQQRENTIEEVNHRKAELHRLAEEQLHQEEALYEAEEFAKAQRAKEECIQKAAAVRDRLQQAFDRQHDAWSDELVKAVLYPQMSGGDPR